MAEQLKERQENVADTEKAEIEVSEKSVFAKTATLEKTEEVVEEDAQAKYLQQLKIFEERVKRLHGELMDLFHKSQETFEKQLSYISAGALGLSVGFIKDIVHPIGDSKYKWMLVLGWGLLISTLLLNLVSHMLAAKYARKGAKETEDIENTYDSQKINRRNRRMDVINWTTIGMLAGGIILIVLYITCNVILK